MSGIDSLLETCAHLCEIVQGAPTRGAPGSARSYLADGRCVLWTPPVDECTAIALDAEIADQPVPRSLARRFGVTRPAQFWPVWTAVEVTCKLREVSILVWLRTHGLRPDQAIATRTMPLADAVVSVGAISWGPSGVRRGEASPWPA